MVWDLLDATCDEIGRNGFKRIVIINGHGGNPEMIRYFMQTRLDKKRNYAVYFFEPPSDSTYAKTLSVLHKSPMATDQHAGERETSEIMFLRPDLVTLDSAAKESGANQKRLTIPNVYTPIWWYANFPNHYAGEGATGTKKLGEFLTEHTVRTFADALKTIKADTKTLELQNEYYNRVRTE